VVLGKTHPSLSNPEILVEIFSSPSSLSFHSTIYALTDMGVMDFKEDNYRDILGSLDSIIIIPRNTPPS
jgi:hypothetical protein